MKRIRVETMNAMRNEKRLLEVGKANFESEVLDSKQPVLVVFCTPWSRACGVLQPVLKKVMRASSGSVKFVKINSDENPDLSLWYGIHSIPLLLYFVDGVATRQDYWNCQQGSHSRQAGVRYQRQRPVNPFRTFK